MDKDILKELAAAYSLGALDENEKREFEALLEQGDPQALQAYKEMQEVASLLPYSVEAVPPSAHLKSKIMAEIQQQAVPGKSFEAKAPETAGDLIETLRNSLLRWKRITWGMAFAFVLLLLLGSGYIYFLRNDINSLSNRVELGNRLIQDLRVELAQKERILQVVQAPASKVIALNGTQIKPDASAKVIYEPGERKAVFFSANLPLPPADKDYQLWMLHGNQPIDAGLLKADEQGNLYAEFETIPEGELSAFAVTLEPKGGQPQPTLEAMYLLGAVKG